MIERYSCPFCRHVNGVALARILEDGETDLRGKIKDRQKLKLELPARLVIACEACGREFVITPSGPGPVNNHG
ncbi:hypothetical protein ACFLQW_01655 [Candidatus Zixiibacteriota bacterium]